MFDPVSDEVLRRRRLGLIRDLPPVDPSSRTALVCSVCGREMSPEEHVFLVMGEVHCAQCHDMLEFELERERQVDKDIRTNGTRWQKKG